MLFKYSMQLWCTSDNTDTVLYFCKHHFQTLMKSNYPRNFLYLSFSRCRLFCGHHTAYCVITSEVCSCVTAPISSKRNQWNKMSRTLVMSCICPSLQCLRKKSKDWSRHLVAWTKLNIPDSNTDQHAMFCCMKQQCDCVISVLSKCVLCYIPTFQVGG